MALEVERKFLVKAPSYKVLHQSLSITQGYLYKMPDKVIRVRKQDNRAFITIKGRRNDFTRLEFEYEIPLEDADYMLANLCDGKMVYKKRHIVFESGNRWEIDEFLGENEGLVIAEIELENADSTFKLPSWIGAEVTHDPRYLNANLAEHPFRSW
jgi:adenylate cyclase